MIYHKQSDCYDWDLYDSDESYLLIRRRWDVTKAKQFIIDKPRPVKFIDTKGLWSILDSGLVGVNRTLKALFGSDRPVDLSHPLILGYSEELGSHWIIDGWNRVTEARDQGITRLHAVALTQDENKECLM